MQVIKLHLQIHRNEQRIFAEFHYNKLLNSLVRQVPEIRWSNTHKQWHFPAEKKYVTELQKKISGVAKLDVLLLKKQLAQRNVRVKATAPPGKDLSTNSISTNNVNAHVLPLMLQHLKLKGYSTSTIKTYKNEQQLLNVLSDIPADDLEPDHLKRYLILCYEKLHLKENTLHSGINAMKFYYEQVLGSKVFLGNTTT